MKIKNLSYSLQFAVLRAGAEAEYAHCTSPGIEYWFLGILKLSELKAKDAFRLPESELKAIDSDIEAVKAALQEYGIDSGTLRARLRHALKHGAKSAPDSIDKYLEPALKAAKLRGQENVWAIDLLRILLETPTDTLKDFLPQKEKKEDKPEKADSPVGKKEEKAEASPSSAQGRDFLPSLTEKVRRLRAALLNTVQGQDHVVHAFAEGIFAAEVLAAADEKRVRPRAIFAFVGPPGVGKTFLAEQAAKNLGLPYQRFDMSTYADHQSYMGLVGFEPSYKDAKEGLLTGVARSTGGFRQYSDEDMEWLGLVCCLKNTGMPLQEIARFVRLAHEGDCTLEERVELLKDHREKLISRMEEMQRYLDKITWKVNFFSGKLQDYREGKK